MGKKIMRVGQSPCKNPDCNAKIDRKKIMRVGQSPYPDVPLSNGVGLIFTVPLYSLAYIGWKQ
jgi:hypothetical protein